jgi:branched-chain amino acid transport system ATP-binding protein
MNALALELPALEISGLRKRFGGVAATQDVSLTVMPGERRLLIGPNGAGKTTLFNLITGDLRADAGSIRLFGQELRGMPTRRRVSQGLGRTYQILTLFPQETLIHNVAMALIGTGRTGWVPWGAFSHRRALREAAEVALAHVGLAGSGDRIVAETAYGERRRLELAMALAQHPRVLLLDEPLAGLSAPERVTVAGVLERLPREIAIVLIEHDMDMALAFAERITLLNFGAVVLEGSRAEVIADPRTREVYFGG